MTDVQTAEMLWARAHEQVKRGDFATAVRDLATCFQILQALGDSRVYEVHKRWTEVHQMYLEDGARQEAPQAQPATSWEAEAEAAANAGDLDTAIDLYTRITGAQPHNELARERLSELTQARRRANDLATGTAPPVVAHGVAAQPAPEPSVPASAEQAPASGLSDDDWSDINVDSGPHARTTSSVDDAFAAEVAPTMAVEDAPVGMQSLDVPFSVGEAIDSFQADDLPVEGDASLVPAVVGSLEVEPPMPALEAQNAVVSDVAFLEELLARVQAHRRPRVA